MPSNEDYFRRYLDDPTILGPSNTPQQATEIEVTDTNESYYRKYLVDPSR